MGRDKLIQLRRGTAADWASTNPTLASGEGGLETDTGKVKYGDGSTAWASLGYVGAGNAGTVTVGDAGGDTTCWVLLGTSQTGNLSPSSDAGLTYNATTNALTATTFVGALTGDVTGNVSGSAGSVAAANLTGNTLAAGVTASSLTSVGTLGNLTVTNPITGSVTGNAGTVTVADAGGDTTTWVLLGTSQTGSLAPASDAGLTYNANTNALTATTFVGALSGNATTATTLATPRTINNVSFDGSANIVVNARSGITLNDRIVRPNNHGVMSSQAVTIDSTAYFVYLGTLAEAITFKFVKVRMTLAGSGAQTAEVGMFSSPNPPNGAGQTLTKLWADGTLDNLASGTGIRANTSASSTSIAAGTHLWAAIRTAMASAEPTLQGGANEWDLGNVLQITSASALTSYTNNATASLLAAVNTFFPELVATQD